MIKRRVHSSWISFMIVKVKDRNMTRKISESLSIKICSVLYSHGPAFFDDNNICPLPPFLAAHKLHHLVVRHIIWVCLIDTVFLPFQKYLAVRWISLCLSTCVCLCFCLSLWAPLRLCINIWNLFKKREARSHDDRGVNLPIKWGSDHLQEPKNDSTTLHLILLVGWLDVR